MIPFKEKSLRYRLLVCLAIVVMYLCSTGLEAPVRVASLSGPDKPSVLPAQIATRPDAFAKGEASRLAVLLTDEDSNWLGVVHGLKTMGIPFVVTRDYRVAIQHRAVFAYPVLSGKTLSADALAALAQYAEHTGTLIGGHVLGGGLGPVFGFNEAIPSMHTVLALDANQPLNAEFTEKEERRVPIGNPSKPALLAGTYSYSAPVEPPLATYEDGSAAILRHQVAPGRYAYTFGLDLGFMLLKGYNNREEGIAPRYVNTFEPEMDVLLRLLRNIYVSAVPEAVTVSTVPDGKRLSVLLSHDIDFTRSIRNAVDYARMEKKEGVTSTFFIQTKYVKDWNDDVFFDEDGAENLRTVRALGGDIGSHSVAHSQAMTRFPSGTGEERYPDYHPFVRTHDITDNGTIFGELRVSKFLLESVVPGLHVESFRPGHLRNPYRMPQLLQASGYAFSSSVTANNSLTHLPFRLNYNRDITQELNMYEFPITIEDEEQPKLGDRVAPALVIAEQLKRYGGLMVILIHTDMLGHKFAFEQQFIRGARRGAWFGNITQFGHWWVARDQVQVDVQASGTQLQLTIPVQISGLTLRLPAGVVASSVPDGLTGRQEGSNLILNAKPGTYTVPLKKDVSS